MSEKHTPGPWEAQGRDITAPWPAEEQALADKGLVGPRKLVVDDGVVETADARLIAAAPEMLALLRRAAEECTDDNGRCYHRRCVHGEIETLLDRIDGT